MNQKTKIRILTGVGLTKYKELGELIGQGSFGGALVSALNLDLEVNDYFEDSQDEIYYGNVRIQPLLYQDDIIRLSTSRDNSQSGNMRMEQIMKSKQFKEQKNHYNLQMAETELEDLLQGNRLYNFKDTATDYIKRVTGRETDSFNVRETRKFISELINQIKQAYEVKE